MQTVSTAWKENQKQNFTSESFLKVYLTVGDDNAIVNASVLTNGSIYISIPDSITQKDVSEPPKYATFEHNSWLLNGSFQSVPVSSPFGDNGYIGEWVSSEDKTFKVIPKITLKFTKTFETVVPGITVTWGTAYDEFPESFQITAYNDNTIVADKTVERNREVVTFTPISIGGYNRIEISILKWCLPFRRPRLQNLYLGKQTVFTKNEITGYSHSMLVDPLSASLPQSGIDFSIVDLEGKYNPDNPESEERFLNERQRMEAFYGYKLGEHIEWIPAGHFFLAEWNTDQNGNEASFIGKDVIEFMRDPYTGPLTGNLYDIAVRAINQADTPIDFVVGENFLLDENLKNIQAPETVEIDADTTVAEVLQYIANAGCCVFYQDRKSVVHIEKRQNSKASQNYIISDNGHAEGFASENLKNRLPSKRYATLEKNIWILNGLSYAVPENPDYGFVSDKICNENGSFNINPSITLAFSEKVLLPIPGIDIKWAEQYGEYAKRFAVSVYDGQTQVIYEEFENTQTTLQIDLDMKYFDRIKIEILQWSTPIRRARVEDIRVRLESENYYITKFISYANAELELGKPLKEVDINNGKYILKINPKGELQQVSNPFISDEQAPYVAKWIADYFAHNQAYKGEYRPDPRLDTLDRVKLENRFGIKDVLITSLNYSYNGAFHGDYEGRADA